MSYYIRATKLQDLNFDLFKVDYFVQVRGNYFRAFPSLLRNTILQHIESNVKHIKKNYV